MITTDLGPVTAYAEAVAQGYTGTKEEFGKLLANYTQTAEKVAEDKVVAEQAMESAKASADRASTSEQNAKASEDAILQKLADAKTEVDASVEAGKKLKTDLDKSIADSTKSKTALDESIKSANSSKTALNETVEQITKNKTDIISLKEDIDNVIDKQENLWTNGDVVNSYKANAQYQSKYYDIPLDDKEEYYIQYDNVVGAIAGDIQIFPYEMSDPILSSITPPDKSVAFNSKGGGVRIYFFSTLTDVAENDGVSTWSGIKIVKGTKIVGTSIKESVLPDFYKTLPTVIPEIEEDIGDMATVIRLTDIIKDKSFGYCNGVENRSFVGNTLNGMFFDGDFVEIGKVEDLYLKNGREYRIAYKVINTKEDIVIRSMADYAFKNVIKNITESEPNGYVDFIADRDLNIAISSSGDINFIRLELYVFDITGVTYSVRNLIDWTNISHNMHRAVVAKSIDSDHAKNADYAKIAEKLLSDSDDNGLKSYKSRNLLDISKITKGLLSNGNIEENESYVTTDFINISDVNNIVSYCNDDRTDMPFNIISFYDNEQAHIGTIVNWDSGMLACSKTDMPDNAIFARLSYYKDYFGKYYNYQMIENGDVKTHWQAYFNAYKSSEVQPMFDKIIDTLGDSITEQMKWQKYIADNLHTGTIFNHGIGGTRISGDNANAMWQDVRINALDNNIDCLLIMGGTNDSAQNATVGELSRENTDTNTFIGAYNVLLSKIFYKYYHLGSGFSGVIQTEKINPIQIMIATPIYCNHSDYGNMDNIATAVRGISDMWGIPVADQHCKSGINSVTSSIYLADDIHPNLDGGKRVANVWINALKANSNLTF